MVIMKWDPEAREPKADFDMPHNCVSWERLDKLADSRRIHDLYSPGYLVHPSLGPAFPTGHSSLQTELKAELTA